MGLPPPPMPDFAQLAAEATPSDPAAATLLRKHSAMLQLVHSALALLWRCADAGAGPAEAERQQLQRARVLWLDALHSCVLSHGAVP